MKSEIIRELGEGSILLPSLIREGLAANDRIKVRMSALQAAAQRAERPEAPIIALTPSVETARRLSLAWGLHCVLTDDAHDLDDVVGRAAQIAESEEFTKPGERIVITAGVPLGTPGATNLLRVAFIGGR
jgi:pyruvate kinase